MWKLLCCERWGCFDLSFAFRQSVCACVCLHLSLPLLLSVHMNNPPLVCMNWFFAVFNNCWPLWDHGVHVEQEVFAVWATHFWRYLWGKGSEDWWSNFKPLPWGTRGANFSTKDQIFSYRSAFGALDWLCSCQDSLRIRSRDSSLHPAFGPATACFCAGWFGALAALWMYGAEEARCDRRLRQLQTLQNTSPPTQTNLYKLALA